MAAGSSRLLLHELREGPGFPGVQAEAALFGSHVGEGNLQLAGYVNRHDFHRGTYEVLRLVVGRTGSYVAVHDQSPTLLSGDEVHTVGADRNGGVGELNRTLSKERERRTAGRPEFALVGLVAVFLGDAVLKAHLIAIGKGAESSGGIRIRLLGESTRQQQAWNQEGDKDSDGAHMFLRAVSVPQSGDPVK